MSAGIEPPAALSTHVRFSNFTVSGVEVGSERENERVLWAHCAAEAASLDNRPAAGGYVGKKTSGFCGSSWGWHPYSMQCKALAASGDTL